MLMVLFSNSFVLPKTISNGSNTISKKIQEKKGSFIPKCASKDFPNIIIKPAIAKGAIKSIGPKNKAKINENIFRNTRSILSHLYCLTISFLFIS